jgi:hypothetical protein
MRKCGSDDIDEALLDWFKVQRDAGFPIIVPILKIQAEKFAMQLEHKDYSCSNGWLDRFKIGITSFMLKSVERPYQQTRKQQVNGGRVQKRLHRRRNL